MASMTATPDELKTRNTDTLCYSWYQDQRQKVMDELLRRSAIEAGDVQTIKSRQIHIGMNECSLMASWGPPSTTNRTVTANGTLIQYVFGSLHANYVYMQNGRITGIQN